MKGDSFAFNLTTSRHRHRAIIVLSLRISLPGLSRHSPTHIAHQFRSAMSTNETVSDKHPPDGYPEPAEQYNLRAAETNTSEHRKDALIEKLKAQLSLATIQNEHNCTLLSMQKKEISQLTAATEHVEQESKALREDLDKAKMKLKDASTLAEQKEQLEAATRKSEQDTKLIDALRQENSQLKGAATESERQKPLVADLQRKFKLLEEAAVKAQQNKHEEERRI